MALPVTLDDAKAQLKILDDALDGEIEDFIRDAAAWVEDYTGLILEARDTVEQFSGLAPVTLRAWPIAASATAAITADGLTSPTAVMDLSQRPARVRPDVGCSWPFTDPRQAFTVTVRAGYENASDVPRNLRRAMLVLITAYDADREGGSIFAAAEQTAARLCRRFKRYTL